MENNELLTLYTSYTDASPKSIEPITGSGSNRQYVRFTSAEGQSIIGVIGTSVEENHAFITLARHFAAKGLPVPQVLAVSDDEHCYLQSDLGSRSLFDALHIAREAGGQYGEVERELLRRTIAELPRLQVLGAQGLDFSVCYPQPEMDETNIMFDLNYFKYCFLKATGIDFHELRLEHDFHQLARDLLDSPPEPVQPEHLIVPSSWHPVREGVESFESSNPSISQVIAPSLRGRAGGESPSFFLYRDFQARNVMLDAKGNPHFIDFQGGRRGPLYYDLASFLWQASARYPQSLRDELIAVYRESLDNTLASIGLPPFKFQRSTLNAFVLFRLLQVLGAYGFRGYFERKQHFLDSIPPALANLREVLKEEGCCPYSELRMVLEKLIETQPLQDPHLQDSPPEPVQPEHLIVPSSWHPVREGVECIEQASAEHSVHSANSQPSGRPSKVIAPSLTGCQEDGTIKCSGWTGSGGESSGGESTGGGSLVVRIFSFSYKRGIPEDKSCNGGGYVFDCRSTHNPGRYEPYKQLTGLDAPVIRFLEDDGEITIFLDSVYRLADHHVERYLQRGFSDLIFSFGCTGGQHRSVYCAQHLAEHLNKKYGVCVDLTHREQGIHTILPSSHPFSQ